MNRSEPASPHLQRLGIQTSDKQVWRGSFVAMANPCEILLETQDAALAKQLTDLAANEARRIECKFSRYRDDSVIHAINNSAGKPVEVDAETAQLLDYGQLLWQLSEHAFDITSGILRRIWKFDAGNDPPSQHQINEYLRLIGWQRVQWQAPFITLVAGMELDFGGIGKEYAVDRVAGLLSELTTEPVLINFGGDLRAIGSLPASGAWQVGIESIEQQGRAQEVVQLRSGALATSGDTHHRIEHRGKRYGHIMDARTGWPAQHTPRSITVAANTCTQAGTYTTLAMLKGSDAEAFLNNEEVQYWCFRQD